MSASRLVAWPGHAWLALPVRVYLGVVFLLACWHKIQDPAVFALDVATYQFLPLELINLFALVLPMVELVAGVMLITGLRSRAAALLVTLMMVAFIIALSAALAKDLQLSCGCFASAAAGEEDAISGMTLLRDSVWLAMSIYVLVFDHRPIGMERLLTGRRAATS
ncbi:MAG: DoxX family protein [Proteobacteria bacterium]|nr:MAG: DoxX family protein [Pseudomonadota bacterium]